MASCRTRPPGCSSAESGSTGSRAPAEPTPPPGLRAAPPAPSSAGRLTAWRSHYLQSVEPQQPGALRQQPGALDRSCPPRLAAPTGTGPAVPPRGSRRPRQPLVRPAVQIDGARYQAVLRSGQAGSSVRTLAPAARPATAFLSAVAASASGSVAATRSESCPWASVATSAASRGPSART
jgi:hypothetical protein